MKTKDGKTVEIIDDENEPSEIITDRKTGKKIRKRKIKNEDGEIEDVKEIIEDEEPSEIDEVTGKKKPKVKKYINSKGKIIKLTEEPSEEDEDTTKKQTTKKIKPKKPLTMTTEDGKKVKVVVDDEELMMKSLRLNMMKMEIKSQK